MVSELTTAFRTLTFRVTRDELNGLNRRHLALGLLFTWVVGMGRWWEDPGANLLQKLGLGSVGYVFLLSLFLWLILWPNDAAYGVLFLTTLLSVYLFVPLFVSYAVISIRRLVAQFGRRKRERGGS